MTRHPLFQLHLLVVVFASTAVLGHLLTLSAAATVVWRALLASVGGAVLVMAVCPRGSRLPVAKIPALLGVGAIIGVHWLCFFAAIRLANISICLVGLATTSFFTAFTGPWLEKRPVRRLEVALGCVVFAGVVLVAGFEPGRLAGLAVALGSAFLAAVFPVLNRRMVRDGLDPRVMIAWEMPGACAVCLGWMLAGGEGIPVFPRGWDLLWIALLAGVCTVFAHAYHIHLLRDLSVYTANLAVNLEPVYGILAAAALFGEHRSLHSGFFVGAATIIAANVAHPLILRAARRGKRAPQP